MKLIFTFFISFFLAKNALAENPDTARFDFPYFEIIFPSGDPSHCDYGKFLKLDPTHYLFEWQIDWQLDESFIIKPKNEFTQVLKVHDRYINSMALRVSETEGVIPFDTTKSSLPAKELFYYSKWVTLESVNSQYSFAKYGYKRDYWQPTKNKINLAEFEKWYLQNQSYYQTSTDQINKREVFCYQRQIRIIYTINNKSNSVVLCFLHRDGTC